MKNKDNLKIDQVVSDLIEHNLIPSNPEYDIDEYHLDAYIRLYQSYSKANGKFNRTYARKLAGLTLVKLKRTKGLKPHQFKEGFVYCIKNPAWPDYTKVGITYDLNSRLKSYQTADPFRAFKISHYEFVLDRFQAEKDILKEFDINLHHGEWLKLEDSTKIIQFVRNKFVPVWPTGKAPDC